MRLQPLDKVKEIATGEHVTVNSAHYLVNILTGEQGVSIVGRPDQVFPASGFELVHRCEFKEYKGVKKCECGNIYTTMADMKKNTGAVSH